MSKVKAVILSASLAFFGGLLGVGLMLMATGKPLQGLGVLTAFLAGLWLFVQVILG